MPTQLASDNFQRANENPLSDGGNWATGLTSTTLQIVSNIVECSGTGGVAASLWTGLNSWPNNQYTEVTIGTLTFNSELGLVVRSDNVLQNYYVGLCTLNEFTLFKLVSNSPTQLAQTTGLTFNSGDRLRLSFEASTWTFFQNGTTVVTGSDSTYSSGIPGFYLDANSSISNAQVTSWNGGSPDNLPPPAPPELHLTYLPTTTAGAVNATNLGSSTSVGQQVPSSVINSPDDAAGTSSVLVPNQGSALVVSGGTVHGRFDKFTVISNPA